MQALPSNEPKITLTFTGDSVPKVKEKVKEVADILEEEGNATVVEAALEESAAGAPPTQLVLLPPVKEKPLSLATIDEVAEEIESGEPREIVEATAVEALQNAKQAKKQAEEAEKAADAALEEVETEAEEKVEKARRAQEQATEEAEEVMKNATDEIEALKALLGTREKTAQDTDDPLKDLQEDEVTAPYPANPPPDLDEKSK